MQKKNIIKTINELKEIRLDEENLKIKGKYAKVYLIKIKDDHVYDAECEDELDNKNVIDVAAKVFTN